jgi:hypothetical protein
MRARACVRVCMCSCVRGGLLQKQEGAGLRRECRDAKDAMRAVMAQAGDDAVAMMQRLRNTCVALAEGV